MKSYTYLDQKRRAEIIHAAATDAGNRHMRAAGRKVWNRDDFNAAVKELERLAVNDPKAWEPANG